jgi:AraC-like DNA-binding protein
MPGIKKVIVVFKTHLDVGFTDYAAAVLEKYRHVYIPQAAELAFAVNAGTKRRFVWTAGSYLVHHYLSAGDVSPEHKARLEEALRLGYVRWHALACTTHTEFMDPALLRYDLSLSKQFDARFGMKTIAAKMTDVPGHTIAMITATKGDIIYMKLSRAKELLRSNRYSVNEAAYMCGYEDEYYFSQGFKKNLGIPPGEYLKNLRR